ncbi:MAG: archaemetzincin family Zn-dependent metalloprotease [Candidatus Bathyarchaeota archaeon]|nr:archaemetzincin family Zn-dependent metalloprotease [Candidatus Bathyarchaeota archaeon]
MELAILRIGSVNSDVVHQVKQRLSEIFPKMVCVILDSEMPIPREAYNAKRKQFHSSRILAEINQHVEKTQATRVLGITYGDLYVPRLNFVFGEAECPGKAALISLCRLEPEFYGDPSNITLFVERSVKEAVHEVGHTLGLAHCRAPTCVMFFSNSILETDRKNPSFCERCRSLVVKYCSVL